MTDQRKDPRFDKSLPPQRADFNRTQEEIIRQRLLLEQNSLSSRQKIKNKDLERRRILLRLAKWILPAAALILLGLIAAWPEVDRIIHSNKAAIAQLEHLKVESGTMLSATYRGLDAHSKPFMITADKAVQNSEDEIFLTNPAADTFSSDNTWLFLRADNGVYIQQTQYLDLYKDVMLYRNDGVIMRGPSADIALKSNIVTSENWVHAEGPFGILDAQGYFMAQHEGFSQFKGPSRLILNDEHIAPPPPSIAHPIEDEGLPHAAAP
ncbi:LPS export ABC transporter periplasmic protein LptC [Entomobacter blattae]|uniref:LPS export ABC transporter periplasmic protein LptC n=1 Tax=Entomobacter blattae TaxID=2762277 RepID=A0A7H1NSN6_9PROT|nr:LPS export ABC transporter periplasmic protein LptC [Entomobacter blattae]QNT78796.1 hypothetical protein JGUZn3_15730 [Entomobacter blattae]